MTSSSQNKQPGILTIDRFPAGAIIFNKGDTGATTFLVKEGRIQIFEPGEKGEPVVKGYAGPGQLFGTRALLGDFTRPIGAKATVPTLCVGIHQDKLQAALKGADPFIAGLFQVLAGNMQAMIDKGADLNCLLEEIETD